MKPVSAPGPSVKQRSMNESCLMRPGWHPGETGSQCRSQEADPARMKVRKTTVSFISLIDAARYEEINYQAMLVRVQRGKYIDRLIPRPGGGRPLREIALTSLSPAAQERYWKEHSGPVVDAVISDRACGEPPWYVECDFFEFCHERREEYERALVRVEDLRKCMALPRNERAAAYEALADESGVDVRTIRNGVQKITEAEAWAKKLENGSSRSVQLQAMALCRKPREKDGFPDIPDELKALVENVTFDRELSRNNPSVELIARETLKQAEQQGMTDLPNPRAISKYVRYLMKDPGNRMAYNLSAKGSRRFKNEHQMKTRRDTKALKVLEYVMGDEHTFDFWAEYVDKTGRHRAVRPVLVTWQDVRSRVILGATICEHADSAILKRSILKMIYDECGSVPHCLHMDNGKDYTARVMTGRKRSERWKDGGQDADSALKGFYRQIGIQEITNSMPYEPWGKGEQERFYNRLNEQFSKLFSSYTGTLTGSRTDAKVKKDVNALLNAGKLPTFEDVMRELNAFLAEYHSTVHCGLKDAGEEWTKPLELFEKAERYCQPCQPYAYAVALLLDDAPAYVHKDGIQKNRRRYWDYSLAPYIGHTVNIKFNPDKPEVVHVFDAETGAKICEAQEAEPMSFHATPEQVAAHKREQNRQLSDARETLNRMRTPYAERMEGAEKPGNRTASLPGLMKEGDGRPIPANVVYMPQDREYSAEAQEQGKRRQGDRSLQRKPSAALYEEIKKAGRRVL